VGLDVNASLVRDGAVLLISGNGHSFTCLFGQSPMLCGAFLSRYFSIGKSFVINNKRPAALRGA
jgi:hypothetical protein